MKVPGEIVAVQDGCNNVGNHNSVDLGGKVSLSQYGLLNSIEIDVNRIPFVDGIEGSGGDGPGGTAWCHHWAGEQEFTIDDIQLATIFPSLLSLSVTDSSDPSNRATGILDPTAVPYELVDEAIADLYLAADQYDQAHIDLSALFAPETYDNIDTDERVYVRVYPLGDYGEPIIDNLTYNYGPFNSILLDASGNYHDFVITAWLDNNHSNPPTRQVDVHVVTVESLTVWNDQNWSNSVTTSDDTTPQLSLTTGADGMVHVGFAATFAPSSDAAAGRLVHWQLADAAGKTISRGDFSDPNVPGSGAMYAPGAGAATLTVYVDSDANGSPKTGAARRTATIQVVTPTWSATTMAEGFATAADNHVNGKAGYEAAFQCTFGGDVPNGEPLGRRRQVWQSNVITQGALCLGKDGQVEWVGRTVDETMGDLINITEGFRTTPFLHLDVAGILPLEYDRKNDRIDPNSPIAETLMLYKYTDKTVGFNPPGNSFPVREPSYWWATPLEATTLARMSDPHEQPQTRYLYVNKARIDALYNQNKIDPAMAAAVMTIASDISWLDWEGLPNAYECLDCGSLGFFQY
jgi:hypothetical protein